MLRFTAELVTTADEAVACGARENGLRFTLRGSAALPERRSERIGNGARFGRNEDGWMRSAFLSPRFIYCVGDVVVMVM
jgi:hypothetical protein